MAQKVPFSYQNPYGNIPQEGSSAGRSPAGGKPAGKNPHAPSKRVSLLKKNELLLIFIGALVVTLVVFFVFFRTPESELVKNKIPTPDRSGPLEERIAALEAKIEKIQAQEQNQIKHPGTGRELFALEQKIARVESGLMLKVDAQIPRITAVEQRINTVEEKVDALSENPGSRNPDTAAPAEKTANSANGETLPAGKPVANLTRKPALEKSRKPVPMFHTVKKGETLWAIAQKYNTSVAALRKLNNLSKDAPIYPGINILVR